MFKKSLFSIETLLVIFGIGLSALSFGCETPLASGAENDLSEVTIKQLSAPDELKVGESLTIAVTYESGPEACYPFDSIRQDKEGRSITLRAFTGKPGKDQACIAIIQEYTQSLTLNGLQAGTYSFIANAGSSNAIEKTVVVKAD